MGPNRGRDGGGGLVAPKAGRSGADAARDIHWVVDRNLVAGVHTHGLAEVAVMVLNQTGVAENPCHSQVVEVEAPQAYGAVVDPKAQTARRCLASVAM